MRKNPHLKRQEQKKGPFNGSWDLSRRRFLVSVGLGAAAVQLPLQKLNGQIFRDQQMLNKNQLSILTSVQEILFPGDENGPGARDVNAAEYLIWVLSDEEKDPEEVAYIIDGIGWVDETAEEELDKKYLDLSQPEREKLIAKISGETWGESWLSVILSFIFEALLCDPQYKGNPEEAGWRWLSHDPGQPRPRREDLYPRILKKKLKPG